MKKNNIVSKIRKTKEDFRKFAGILKGSESLVVELIKTKKEERAK